MKGATVVASPRRVPADEGSVLSVPHTSPGGCC